MSLIDETPETAIAEVAIPSATSILIAIRIARRIAFAIAAGSVEAREIDAMTDDEILKNFDDEKFNELLAKQTEAERMASIDIKPPPVDPFAGETLESINEDLR